ncbi:hypothetical protein ACLE20_08410 [Rhizobium sp. YIM 134829]|uniref:hypothetical protein n=1 Tax=Rhizobium sp. YIM 134829 TaxID=3390453 RepID=UPI0039782AE7
MSGGLWTLHRNVDLQGNAESLERILQRVQPRLMVQAEEAIDLLAMGPAQRTLKISPRPASASHIHVNGSLEVDHHRKLDQVAAAFLIVERTRNVFPIGHSRRDRLLYGISAIQACLFLRLPETRQLRKIVGCHQPEIAVLL